MNIYENTFLVILSMPVKDNHQDKTQTKNCKEGKNNQIDGLFATPGLKQVKNDMDVDLSKIKQSALNVYKTISTTNKPLLLP